MKLAKQLAAEQHREVLAVDIFASIVKLGYLRQEHPARITDENDESVSLPTNERASNAAMALEVVEYAIEYVRVFRDAKIRVDHLVLALCKLNDGLIDDFCENKGIDREHVTEYVFRTHARDSYSFFDAISNFGDNNTIRELIAAVNDLSNEIHEALRLENLVRARELQHRLHCKREELQTALFELSSGGQD